MIMEDATAKLKASPKAAFRKRYSPADMNGAIYSAAAYAKEAGQSLFVYTGNSYMNLVRRVTYKRSDAANGINNPGRVFFEVTPDLTVIKHTF